MSYKTTDEFLRMFGYSSLEELPELPRYKLDENQQIVIDDLIEENSSQENKDQIQEEGKTEAPMPAREGVSENNKEE